jgi:hypothetical protein
MTIQNGQLIKETDCAEIWHINGWYFLFETHLLTSNPLFSGYYSSLEEALEETYSWT